MNVFERFQTVVVMAGIAVGLAAAQLPGVPAVADRLIFPALLVMLFAAFAGIPLEGLRRALGLAVGRLLDFSYPEVACFNCTVLSQNSPTALAIAVVAFPNEPLIALALVVGPLLELPQLPVVANLLRRVERRGWGGEDRPSEECEPRAENVPDRQRIQVGTDASFSQVWILYCSSPGPSCCSSCRY